MRAWAPPCGGSVGHCSLVTARAEESSIHITVRAVQSKRAVMRVMRQFLGVRKDRRARERADLQGAAIRRSARVIATIIITAAVIFAVVWFGQRGLIYCPDSHVPPPVAVGLAHAEPVMFDTEDGLALAGWYVPAIPPVSGYTIIVFNGNAGHRGYRAAWPVDWRHAASPGTVVRLSRLWGQPRTAVGRGARARRSRRACVCRRTSRRRSTASGLFRRVAGHRCRRSDWRSSIRPRR